MDVTSRGGCKKLSNNKLIANIECQFKIFLNMKLNLILIYLFLFIENQTDTNVFIHTVVRLKLILEIQYLIFYIQQKKFYNHANVLKRQFIYLFIQH